MLYSVAFLLIIKGREQTDCHETSVRNYNSSLYKISKELRSLLQRGGSQKSLIIKCMLAGAIRVDNCPRKYRRSNRSGRWSWWPHQWQPLVSKNYQSNQEIIWVYLLRIFVTVLKKCYNSTLTWATSVTSLTSHYTSWRSSAFIFQFTPSPSCIKFRAFWNMKPYILVEVHWSFEGISCFNFQVRRSRQQFRTKLSHLSRYTA
jgi:hypothetical protein